MKTFAKSIGSVALMGAMGCGNAYSQDLVHRTNAGTPSQDGMTQIDSGLYAKVTDTDEWHSESYVAIGATGQQALLLKLGSMRDARHTDEHGDSKSTTGNQQVDALDDLIQRLSNPEKAASNPVTNGYTDHAYGNCNGVDHTENPTDPFFLQALAGGGPNGSGGASAGVWNTDASLYTTNYAHATARFADGSIAGSQTVTTYGTTAAVASQLYPNGCSGDSGATITCPGHTTPSISVFANAIRNKPGCNP